MPYNISRSVCVKHKKILQQMLDERRTFQIPVQNATKRAREIREALEAVKHHDEFKYFAHLAECYRVRTKKKFVELEWLGENEAKETTTNTVLNQQTQENEAEDDSYVPDAIRVESVSELLHIIGATIKLKEETNEVYFPDAALSEEDKLKLYEWGKTKGWKYIDHEGAGLTLTQRNVDEFILWEPPTVEDIS